MNLNVWVSLFWFCLLPDIFHMLFPASIMLTDIHELQSLTSFFFLKSLSYCKNDLFPEEGIWLWKNGMPLLSAFRTLAIGTLLGPRKERQVNWYLEPAHLEKLLSQLMPQLDKLAQIIQHYAISVCLLPLV